MTARKRPLAAELAAMNEAIVAAKRRAREAEQAQRRAEADVARLRDAVIDAHSVGDEARARKVSAERDKIEQVALRDTAERLEGATRAVAKAEAELGLFAREHADALIAERHPDAVAAATEVEDAIEQLGRAQERWSAVEGDTAALLRLAGQKTGDLPRLPQPVAELIRDARKASGTTVPPPIPGGGAAVVPALKSKAPVA